MSKKNTITKNRDQEFDIHIRNHIVVIQKRYEFFYNLNEILIGILFVIGSIFFFWTATKVAGTWLFVIGSFEFLIRPFIKIGQKIHLQKINDSSSDTPPKTDQ